MMAEDELAELAEDIKANGLAFPIIIDTVAGVLIDGRNRLAACRLAGVDQRFEDLGDRDPLVFIFSANVKRRNLSKAQQAMAAAMMFPEPERGRGKKDVARKEADSASFSYRRVKEARQVLRSSPDVARAVLAGVKPLDEALDEIKTAQALLSSEAVRMEGPEI